MRLFISGSAPLLAETHREFEARTGHAILERYGMTETNMNTSNPYDGERIAGTVGLPLPGVELRIADPETGAPLPQGEIGMIEVRGRTSSRATGACRRRPPRSSAPTASSSPAISAAIDERGYVPIVGRGKDLIITGGFNVYPKEIESEIDALPGVVECAVIGVPHPGFRRGRHGRRGGASGARSTRPRSSSALDGRLAKFKLPKRVIFVDDLPRNAMGKVQKNMLRERYKELYR